MVVNLYASTRHSQNLTALRLFYIFEKIISVICAARIDKLKPLRRDRRMLDAVPPFALDRFFLLRLPCVLRHFPTLPTLLRRPMIEQIICKPGIISPVIVYLPVFVFIPAVFTQLFDPVYFSICPFPRDCFFRYSARYHVHVKPLRALSFTDIREDHRVRI